MTFYSHASHMPIFPFANEKKQAGHGELDFEKVRSRTIVRKSYAKAPLRLMNPRNHGDAAWVFTSNYGGGFLGGDHIDLNVRVRAGARAVLLTQSSTKIYKSIQGASQHLYAEIESEGSLVILPDPIVCYANSSFSQSQEFHLQEGASLLFVDTVSSGRQSFGERWAFNTLKNQIRVYRDGKLIFFESLLLDPKLGSLVSRMGRFDALCLVLLIGPEFMEFGKHITESWKKNPVRPLSEMVCTANPLGSEGTLLRIAAVSLEALGAVLRETLCFLPQSLGDNPWARKW